MSWLSGILVYVIIWWLALFMVLPWGAHPPAEPEAGHATSAPERPRMWLKVLITSIIAFGFWLIAYFTIENGWITIRGV